MAASGASDCSLNEMEPRVCRVSSCMNMWSSKGTPFSTTWEDFYGRLFGKTWAGPSPWRALLHLSHTDSKRQVIKGALLVSTQLSAPVTGPCAVWISCHLILEEKETHCRELISSASSQLLKTVRWESGRARKRSRLGSAKPELLLPSATRV